MPDRKWKWRHGALIYGGVALLQGLLSNATSARDRRMYERQRLPVFAPPAIAFPIAWSINSICAMSGLIYVLNLPRGTKGRADYVRWQAVAWTLFATFNAAYFGLRSPMNAAGITILFSAATAASLHAALAKMREPKAAWALATTAAWLSLANPVGITQALWNRDAFWGVGPFAEPPPALLKN